MDANMTPHHFYMWLNCFLHVQTWFSMMFWPLNLDRSIRAVSKSAKQMLQIWKDREFPDVSWEDVFWPHNNITHFSQAQWELEWDSDGDYGRYEGSIKKDLLSKALCITVNIQGGAKRREWCNYTIVYYAQVVNRDIVFINCTKDNLPRDCKDSPCDRTWAALALRMILAPMYVCETIDVCQGSNDPSDDQWFHSDICISCAMNYSARLQFPELNTVYSHAAHRLLDVQELLGGVKPSPWA